MKANGTILFLYIWNFLLRNNFRLTKIVQRIPTYPSPRSPNCKNFTTFVLSFPPLSPSLQMCSLFTPKYINVCISQNQGHFGHNFSAVIKIQKLPLTHYYLTYRPYSNITSCLTNVLYRKMIFFPGPDSNLRSYTGFSSHVSFILDQFLSL